MVTMMSAEPSLLQTLQLLASQRILVLEAMKMQHQIKANVAGTVIPMVMRLPIAPMRSAACVTSRVRTPPDRVRGWE